MRKTIAVSLLGALIALQAQAVQIQGGLTMTGEAKFDTGNVNTANSVTSWRNSFVLASSGDFAANGIGFFTGVLLKAPWVFDPSTPTASLWIVSGGKTFTFDLTSSVIDVQGGNNIAITGNGTVTATGFDPTPFQWNFTSQNPAVNRWFTFSAATSRTRAVPDGGLTLGLLGLALTGLEGLRRRFSR